MKQFAKVVVCPVCKGTGLQYVRNKNGSVAVHRGEPMTEPCEVCGGDRCLLMRVTMEYFRLTPQVVDEEKKKKGGMFSWLKKDS